MTVTSTILDVTLGEQGIAGSPGLPVRLAATDPLPAYIADSQGIIGQSNGVLTIDGVAALAGDNVLVAGETGSASVYNRVCRVADPGSSTTPYHLVFRVDVQYRQGEAVTVGAGTVWKAKQLVMVTDSVVVLGTTHIQWIANTSGGLIAANNLSDVSDVPTARDNLGLGTAATQDSGDFDAAGAAAAALSSANTHADANLALSALKANNLSDLASAGTARTNLGLGSAATQASSAFDAAGAAAAAIVTAEAFATAADAVISARAGLQDVILYVDSSAGNDSNAGTAGSPFQTLAKALQTVPSAPTGKCRIMLAGAGPYTMPANAAGVSPGPYGEPLVVSGDTFTQITTGTVSSVSGATLTPTVGGMTVDLYRGAIYHGLTGTSSGKYYTIATNSASQLTSIGNTFGAANGDTFEILTARTVITGPDVQINGSGKIGFYRCKFTWGATDIVESASVLFDACNLAGTGRFNARFRARAYFANTNSIYDFLRITDIGTQSGITGGYFSDTTVIVSGIRAFNTSLLYGYVVTKRAIVADSHATADFLGFDSDLTGNASSRPITVQNTSVLRLTGGYNRIVAGGSGGIAISVIENSMAQLSSVVITNAGTEAILCSLASYIMMTSVTGSSGNGLGVRVLTGGRVEDSSGNTVTGTTGDILIDADSTAVPWSTTGGYIQSDTIGKTSTYTSYFGGHALGEKESLSGTANASATIFWHDVDTSSVIATITLLDAAPVDSIHVINDKTGSFSVRACGVVAQSSHTINGSSSAISLTTQWGTWYFRKLTATTWQLLGGAP